MKKRQVLCLVVAMITASCATNTFAYNVSGITSDDNDWGAFDKLKNLVELKYGDQDNEVGHWEMGLRKKHYGFEPKKKLTDYIWVNSRDSTTHAQTDPLHNDMNPFTLEFTQATGEVIFTLGWPNGTQRQMIYQYDEYAGRGMDELHIMARRGNANHDCSIHDLEMDGDPILAELTGSGKNSYIEITEIGCGDFVLTGYIKFGWSTKPDKNADLEALFAFSHPCDAEFWLQEGNIKVANAGPQSDPWALKFTSKEGESPSSASLKCELPANITFDSIDLLSADYNLGTGVFQNTSPRFSLMLDMNDDGQVDSNDQSVSVHWVVPPDQFDGPRYVWFNTGNLYNSNDLRVDLTQVGGNFYSTINDAKTLIGDKNVLQVSVIVDGSALGDQVVYIDNIRINTYLYDTQPLVVVGDFSNDYQVGSTDLFMLANNWLRTDCLPDPNVCQRTDIVPKDALDGKVDFADFARFAKSWLLGIDEIPPTPYIMGFTSPPMATGAYSIIMTAETAEDETGVEYYFNNVTIPFHDSGWQPSSVFEDTGLYPDVTYVYRVKARDISDNRNETEYSDPNSATTDYADISPPAPDPPTWAILPTATGPHSIAMAAAECTDESGVQYYFFAFDSDYKYDPNHSSGWQDSPSYTDTGLNPNTRYYYRIMVRDKSLNVNSTGSSSLRSATTQQGLVDTLPPVPATMSWRQLPIPTGENSTTMTAVQALDGSGVEYYFENVTVTDSTHDSGWQDSDIYNDTGLTKGTTYTYQVKARDKSPNQNENTWSTQEIATTLADDTAPDPVTWDIDPRAIGSHTIIMTAEIAAEPGVQYYFNNATDPSHDSGWQDSEYYEDAGLDPNTIYTYRVKIRDTYLNETGYSVDASVATALEGAVQTIELLSIAEHDGRIWGNNTAGIYYNSYDSTFRALRIGGRTLFGYAAVTSFDSTRLLPTKTVIQIASANLELTCGYHAFTTGNNDPFIWGGACYIDIDNAFSASPVLSTTDWNYPADASDIARFNESSAPSTGSTMTSTQFSQQGKDQIDRNGITQLRVRFTQTTHSTTGYIGFYSGETPNKEPKLTIQYTD